MNLKLSDAKAVIVQPSKKADLLLDFDKDTKIATGASKHVYQIALDRKSDRYFLTIDGKAVMAADGATIGDKSDNQIIVNGYRGFYYINQVKSFASECEHYFQTIKK